MLMATFMLAGAKSLLSDIRLFYDLSGRKSGGQIDKVKLVIMGQMECTFNDGMAVYVYVWLPAAGSVYTHIKEGNAEHSWHFRDT